MGALLREVGPLMGAKGGGRPDFAQGAGSDPSQLDACLAAAVAAVKAKLA